MTLVEYYSGVVQSHRTNLHYFTSEGWSLPMPRSIDKHVFADKELYAILYFWGRSTEHQDDPIMLPFGIQFQLDGLVQSSMPIQLPDSVASELDKSIAKKEVSAKYDGTTLLISDSSLQKVIASSRKLVTEIKPDHQFDLHNQEPESSHDKKRYTTWHKTVRQILRAMHQ